ncbi:MAG: hypothetical protein BWY65_01765 [Firmicutes bacterium ADurb.Bin373]|nr:MAG: hypothetical protein BWY65_01765 [Firmicutes bacterium ADurb.Bin373]
MDTIGVSDSLPHLKMSLEKPAPVIIRSIFSSIAVCTRAANCLTANMMLMPMIPFELRRAVLISFLSSSSDMPVAAIMPMPPALATAVASGAVDTRIAIPPWMIG